jgi:hypothetical protein
LEATLTSQEACAATVVAVMAMMNKDFRKLFIVEVLGIE